MKVGFNSHAIKWVYGWQRTYLNPLNYQTNPKHFIWQYNLFVWLYAHCSHQPNQLWACVLFGLIHCQTAPTSTYLADQIWLEIRRLSHQDCPTKYKRFRHKTSFSRSVELCVVYSYFCGYGTILREMAEHFWFCTKQWEIVFYIRPFRVEMTDIQTHIFALAHTHNKCFIFDGRKTFLPRCLLFSVTIRFEIV